MINKELKASISPKDLQEIMEHIEAIHKKLPFLTGMTREERRTLFKLNHKGGPFVESSLAVGERHHILVPGFIDIEDATLNIEIYETLEKVLRALNHLSSLVEDTQRLAGSEAYAAAREIYHAVKRNGKGMGLEDVIDDLSRQFAQSRRSSDNQAA